jgi:two-component system chemotaxis response regulator CheB
MQHVEVDYCLPLAEIAPLLARLTGGPAEEEGARPVPEEMDIEIKIAKEDIALDAGITRLGEPSIYACPECHGVLLQLQEGDRVRFRCHTGHAYSVDSLLADITEKTGESLWSAIRALEEGVLLMRHMARHLGEGDNGHTSEMFLKKAQEAQRRAELVRQAVLEHEELSTERIVEGKEP